MTASASGSSVRQRALLGPLGVWVLLAVFAVINGGLRELVLVPRVDERPRHLLSTALLLAAILVVSYAYFTRSSTAPSPRTSRSAAAPRGCIGGDFARQELTLALGTMVGRVDLEVTADGPLSFVPSIQLRPATEFMATVRRR